MEKRGLHRRSQLIRLPEAILGLLIALKRQQHASIKQLCERLRSEGILCKPVVMQLQQHRIQLTEHRCIKRLRLLARNGRASALCISRSTLPCCPVQRFFDFLQPLFRNCLFRSGALQQRKRAGFRLSASSSSSA